MAETKTAIRYLVELGLKAKGKWTQTNFSRANGNRYSTGFCWHCSSSRLSIISSCHARAEGEEVGQPCCIFRLNEFGLCSPSGCGPAAMTDSEKKETTIAYRKGASLLRTTPANGFAGRPNGSYGRPIYCAPILLHQASVGAHCGCHGKGSVLS